MELLGVVLALVALGLGFVGIAFMAGLEACRWHLIVAGMVCFAAAVAIPLAYGVLLPVVTRWRRWRTARAKLAEQKRLDAKRAAERERLIPKLAAWDPFYLAAGEMWSRFYEARDTKSLEKWSAFSEARDRAVALAPGLYEPARGRALELLQPFAEVDKDELEACSVPAVDLDKWMMDWQIRYDHARKDVGLPVPDHGRRRT
jgi:hypothetical protein